MNSSFHPPIIEKLNYEFSGWLGDDLLESFPCYLMSEPLKNTVETEGLTGITFDNVIVTRSEEFDRVTNSIELPNFYWAKINGMPMLNDFFVGEDFRLVISENAFKVVSLFNINYASVEEM